MLDGEFLDFDINWR